MTSGTTGTPIQFHWAPGEPWRGWAFVIHQWKRVGYVPYSFRVEIRGSPPSNPKKVEYTGNGSVRLSPIIINVK